MAMGLLSSLLEGCSATLHMPTCQVTANLKQTAVGPVTQTARGL